MDRSVPDAPSALLVVDMQRRFLSDDGPWKGTVSVINGVADAFRLAGRPVVFMRVVGKVPEHPYRGPEDDLFADDLEVREGDAVVDKASMNSFSGTRLKQILADAGAKTVVICGTLSHLCIAATYFGAFEAGFSPYLLKGCAISGDPSLDAAIETLCRCLDPEDVIAALTASP